MMEEFTKQRICIVTSECVGPFKNGGIGTSMTGLAENMVHHGHEVTVYYTRGAYLTSAEVKRWQQAYAQKGIRFEAVRPADFASYAGPLVDMGYLTPSAVVDFLKPRQFDTVHFNDTDAEGFLALALHRCGFLLPKATFQTNIHSPREWVGALNGESLTSPIDLPMRAAERFVIGQSDLICGPSQYLLDWIADRGYELPQKVIQQQYVMPRDVVDRARRKSAERGERHDSIRRIVFFGRLEERKGLRLFLQTMTALQSQLSAAGVDVAFLGRSVMIGGMSSVDFIKQAATDWATPYQTHTDKGQEEALDFLAEPGTLTVIASPADNSPCTVYECLLSQLPFIAARTGGIPELIAEADHPGTLFDANLKDLSRLVLEKLDGNLTKPAPAVSQVDNIQRWLTQHEGLLRDQSDSDEQPVSDTDPFSRLIGVVDATLGQQATHQSVESLISAGLVPENIKILAPHPFTLPQEGFAAEFLNASAFADFAAGSLGPCLLISAGTTVKNRKTLADVLSHVDRAPCDGFILSALQPGGRRLDHPGLGAAVALCHGPMRTGAVLLKSLKELASHLDGDRIDVGPAYGLLDLSLIKGARLWPIAEAAVENAAPVPSIPLTDSRLGLYRNLPGNEQDAVIVQAVGGASLKLKSLARNVAYKAAASRFGAILPYLFKAGEKLRG